MVLSPDKKLYLIYNINLYGSILNLFQMEVKYNFCLSWHSEALKTSRLPLAEDVYRENNCSFYLK